jgi:hypothetical protein
VNDSHVTSLFFFSFFLPLDLSLISHRLVSSSNENPEIRRRLQCSDDGNITLQLRKLDSALSLPRQFNRDRSLQTPRAAEPNNGNRRATQTNTLQNLTQR